MPAILFNDNDGNSKKKAKGKLIRLDDLIPNIDTSNRKRQRNIKKRKKAKENAKKLKIEQIQTKIFGDVEENVHKIENDLKIQENEQVFVSEEETGYKDYCSR